MFGKKPRSEDSGAESGSTFPNTEPSTDAADKLARFQHNTPPAQGADQQNPAEAPWQSNNAASPSSPASHNPPEDAHLPVLHASAKTKDSATMQGSLVEIQAQQVIDARRKVAAEATKAFTTYTDKNLETPDFIKARGMMSDALIDKIDFQKMEGMSEADKRSTVTEVILKLMEKLNTPLTLAQQELLKKHLMDEMLGFGPLEVLLADPEVADIMVNGPDNVFIEKAGKISKTDVKFQNNKHLLNIIQKIVQRVGRRVDETSPMVDARMPDGSRFNAIIPPLALDGCLVSIRKFKKNKMPLRQYVDYGSCTPNMARFLEICGAIRLNILISGGTGSGKTTLLNALSGNIDDGERVITIEDAAELQLQKPHVLRLETRPPNMEGVGEITQRQLVKNALRMRPDRIILGEIRGDEVIDVLQAMNTGHDGSMATIHANNPRECLTRLENLFGLTGMSLPVSTLRSQIAGAVHLIVQIARMRDGGRRITHIEEICGMEGTTIITQTLFSYKATGMHEDGKLKGEFICHNIKPRFIEQAAYFGMDKQMAETLGMPTTPPKY